jgi:hypothetical protein
MGVVKAVNSPCSSHAALRNTLEYILKDSKTTSELKLVSGMYFEPEVTADKVFQNFTEIRKDAGKVNGRMFKHFILSWSKEEDITPEIGLAITNEWVDKVFPEYNACIVSHTDRDHVHCHIVVNSVNNLTGKKLNISNKQFQKMKNINDELCEQYGLSVTKKGKHFDGTNISEGTIRSNDKTTYHVLTTDSPKRKIMASVMVKVLEATATACSQDEFIIRLAEAGITTNWSSRRKNVSFTDDASGFKIREKKLADTFSTNLSKEVFHEAFIRNERIQRERTSITGEDDRRCQLLEEKIRGLRDGEGTASKRKSKESGNESTDGLIERISEKIRDCFRQRTPEEHGNGESTYRSRNRRHKSMLSNEEQYKILDIASKLEECCNYYISAIYTTLIYNENSFRDKDYYWTMMKDCEKRKYEHLADYRDLIHSIPIEDLAMVHEEQLAIRDREMSRYENGLASPKSGRDFNEKAYNEAISIRDEAFSHIETNLKSIEKDHPEIAEDRILSQTPKRGIHR